MYSPLVKMRSILLLVLIVGNTTPGPAKEWTASTSDQLSELIAKASNQDTVILNGTFRGPLSVAGKQLTIAAAPGSRAVIAGGDGKTAAIAIGEGSLCTLRGIDFRTANDTVAAVWVAGGKAVLEDCTCSDTGRFVYADGGEVSIHDCQVSDTSVNAIQIDGECQVELRGCEFDNTGPHAIAISGASDVVVERCRFADLDGGILSNGAASLMVTRNRFDRIGWAIITDAAKTDVKISKNRISDVKGPDAIYVASTGPIEILSNVLSGVTRGIGLVGNWHAPVNIDGNFVIECAELAVYVQGQPAAEEVVVNIHANGLVTQGSSGVLINGPMQVHLEENVVLAKGGTGIHAQAGAIASFHRNILFGENYGAYLHEVDSASRFTGNICWPRLYPSNGPTQGVSMTRIDRVLRDKAVGQRLGNEIDAVFAAQSSSSVDRLDPFIESMKRLVIDSFGILERAKNLAVNEVELQFDRYVDGKPETVKLPMVLKDRKQLQSIIPSRRYRRHELIAMRRPGATPEECQRTVKLARARLPQLAKQLADARSQEDLLYRQKEWDQVDPVLDRRRRIQAAQTWALRILAVAGTEDDANWMIANCLAPLDREPIAYESLEWNDQVLRHVAHLEARLGVLDQGTLVSLARRRANPNSVTAAAVLHDWGERSTDETLFQYIDVADHWWRLERVITSLSDRSDLRTKLVMRKVVDRFLASEAGDQEQAKQATIDRWGAARAALYLLAFGDQADRSAARRIKFDFLRSWQEFAYMVEDPSEIVDAFLGIKYGGSLRYNYLSLAESIPALRCLPSQRAEQAATHFEDSLVRVAILKPILSAPADLIALYARLSYLPAISRYQPSRRAAKLALECDHKWLSPQYSWVPRPWEETQLVECFFSGSRKFNWELLDHVAHDRLLEAFENHDSSGESNHDDLFLAYHQIATRAFVEPDPLPQGTERRPFVVRVPTSSGAVSGILNLRPELVDGRLELLVKLDVATHYDGGFLPLPEEKAVFRGIEQDTDEERFQRISLRRGEEVIPLNLVKRNAGEYRFTAPFDAGDLSNATLETTLNLGDETVSFVFDLFASQAARDARIETSR